MIESPSLNKGIVTENQWVAPEHFLMTLSLPLAFAWPVPGQFVMVRDLSRSDPLLARPLSIMGFERKDGHSSLEILYHVAGKGTSLLSRMAPGGELDIVGPLGQGFSRPAGIKRVLFIAGGIGVAPLIYLLRSGTLSHRGVKEVCVEPEKVFYLGARTKELLTGIDRLTGHCDLGICTDDGTCGYHGPVTELLGRDMERYDACDTVIYACGPRPMIRALRPLLTKKPIPCQVSLEERMACGLGACLGCVVAVLNPDGSRGYKRVCHDGPVFDLQEILSTTSLAV